jgi:hypothetical protein
LSLGNVQTMGPTNLKPNSYVPTERAQFASPIRVDRREFLARSASVVLRISGNTDLLTESSMLARDLISPLNATNEYVPCDDLTPLEKAARRLMMIASSVKEESQAVFTEEEIIALAFDAGCEVTMVEDANGAAFFPTKMIHVERRPDGKIVVLEDGASEGVVLERKPSYFVPNVAL